MSEHIPLDELSARIDQDELSNARRLQIDAHLADCEDCRIQLESLSWAASFGRALPMTLPPASFELRLPSQSIQAEPERAADPDFDPEPAWWQSGAWQGLAALAAMLVLALMMGRLSPAGSELADPAGAPAGLTLQDSGLGSDALAPAELAEEASEFEAVREAPPSLAPGSAGDKPAAQGLAIGPDMDRAADHAQLRSEDSADTADLIPPLATAIGEDGRRRILRTGTEAVPAYRPAGDATAAAVASELGGYSPPDRPIPGAAVARDRAPVAGATAALASNLDMALARTAEPSAAIIDPFASDDPTGSDDSIASDDPIESDDPTVLDDPTVSESPAQTRDEAAARDGSAIADEAASEPARVVSPDPQSSPAEASLAESDPAAQRSPAPAAPAPAASGAAPRSLLIPLAAISFGLLALATLLLRRVGQERSRRRHRQR